MVQDYGCNSLCYNGVGASNMTPVPVYLLFIFKYTYVNTEIEAYIVGLLVLLCDLNTSRGLAASRTDDAMMSNRPSL